MIAGVVVLSLIPVEVDLVEDGDKIAHFVAYGSLSLWFGMVVPGGGRQLGIALAFVAMGVALEFLQGMTGYRTFSIADMIANAIGAALGWGLAQTPLGNGLAWVERAFFSPP
jgi:VanZ family protein